MRVYACECVCVFMCVCVGGELYDWHDAAPSHLASK